MACSKPAVGICLVVLIGLPGSGKTTMAGFLKQYFSCHRDGRDSFNVIHICYDEFVTDDFFCENINPDFGDWHDARREVLSVVGKIGVSLKNAYLDNQQLNNMIEVTCDYNYKYLNQQCKWDVDLMKPTAIIIDDNMYYSSMRYSYYQLARQLSIGFCQLYLNCSVATAININNKRCEGRQIPEAVIVRMAAKLEPPQNKAWEEKSLTLQAPVSFTDNEIQKQLISLVYESLCNPVKSVKDLSGVAEISFKECPSDFVHQADLVLRQLVGERLRKLQLTSVEKNEIQNHARLYNSARTKILSGLKLKEISVPEELMIAVANRHLLGIDHLRSFLSNLLYL